MQNIIDVLIKETKNKRIKWSEWANYLQCIYGGDNIEIVKKKGFFSTKYLLKIKDREIGYSHKLKEIIEINQNNIKERRKQRIDEIHQKYKKRKDELDNE